MPEFISSFITVISSSVVLLIWLCAPAGPAQGETPSSWSDMGLYGGQVLSLAVDPERPQTMYAGTWGGDGLFKSQDGGMSWTTLPSASSARFRNCEVFDIAIDPADSATLWVAAKQQVAVSTDGGITWRSCVVAPDRFVYCLAVDPHDPSGKTVYAGASGLFGIEQWGALYRTQDAGLSWQHLLTAPHDILDVSLDPLREGQVWAVSAPWSETPGNVGLIYRSDNAGRTWSMHYQAVHADGAMRRFGYLDEIIIVPGSPSVAFVCGAYGIAATSVTSARQSPWHWVLNDDAAVFNALCAAPPPSSTLYASAAPGVYTSHDRGTTWNHPVQAPVFLCLQADPEGGPAAYGGSVNQGVFTTTDNGRSWQQTHTGIQANTVYDIAAAPAGSERICCATLAGLYEKQSDGSWLLLNERTSFSVSYHPLNAGTLYAGFDNMLGKSTDAGASWTYRSVVADAKPHDVTAIALSPQRPDVLFAAVGYDGGSGGALVRLADNGTEFMRSPCTTVLTTDVPVNCVAVDPEDPDVMLAGTGYFYAPGIPGALYRSTDGGRRWHASTLQNVVVNAIAFVPSDPSTVYAACGESGNRFGGIFKSIDSGATWRPVHNGMPGSFSATDIAVDASDGNIVYVSLYDADADHGVPLGGVYASFNAGGYWSQIGLSDYALHSIIRIDNKVSPSAQSRAHEVSTAPRGCEIMAGTESGLFATSTSGSGFITGTVSSYSTGKPLDGAVVSSDKGLHCMSSAGYYCLLLPAGTHSLHVSAPGYQTATLAGVTVYAGAATEQQIVLHPHPGGPCLAERLFEENGSRDILSKLRLVRDRMVLRRPQGRQLHDLYYLYGETIWNIIVNDDRLKQRCRDLLIAAADLYCALYPPSSAQTIPLYNEARRLLRDIEQKAPQSLQCIFPRIERAVTVEIMR